MAHKNHNPNRSSNRGGGMADEGAGAAVSSYDAGAGVGPVGAPAGVTAGGAGTMGATVDNTQGQNQGKADKHGRHS